MTVEITFNTMLDHWIQYCGKPNIIRTDPEGAFRDQGFRRGLAAKSIRQDTGLGDASWYTGDHQTSSNTCRSKNSQQCHSSRNLR